MGADSLTQGTGANPVLSGSGTLVKEGAATGLTLGSLTSFTGTLSVQGGSVTTSAANQLTGSYGINLAAGSTLQLGGNDTLPTSMNTGVGSLEILSSNTLAIANTTARTVDRVFTGTGVVTKTGTGVLTLSGASSHSGGTSFSTGTIKVASNTALGSGTVTVNGDGSTLGGSLDLNGATLSNVVDLRGSNSGMGNVGSLQNTNTGTAAVLNGRLIVGEDYVGSNGDVVLNGVVSSTAALGSTYSIYKQGAGTWTFANTANTFDGFFYIVGGTTAVTKLANQGQTSSLGQPSTSTANRVVFVASSGGVLRFEGSSASISDRGFVLSGGTAATNNVIEAAGTSAAATLTLTGPLSAGAAGTYAATLGGTNAGVNVYAGTIGNGSGSVALVKQGSTTWALTGANSYTGATTVSSGTLKVGNSGTTGVLGGGGVSVATGATLAFDRSDSGLVVADAISGSGAVIQIGSGTTSLTGANTHTSTTEIAAGTLRIGNGNAAGTLGSGGVAIASGATLAFNRSDSVTVSNVIGGAGAVVKQAGGTLTLSGSNAYSGGTRLTAGTLVVGSDQALGTGTLAFAAGTLQTARNVLVPIAVESSGTLAIVGSGVNLTANFLGSGTLTKTGTGTLTLSGPASTFSGNLVIAGGVGANSIVKAGNTSAFGTGTVTILGGGGNTGSTFDLNGQSLDNALVIGLGNSGVNDAGSLMNSNAAVPATLNGAVSLGGEIYVGGAGGITFTGVVSGTVNPANDYSLYKDGAGTWTFANTANTFDGYYYQVGGVTEVTKLANLNEPSSLGQPTTSGRNKVSFGFGGNGGGTIRFIGSTASTSNRELVMSGGTAASSTAIDASGDSAAATLTLTGNLSANRAGTYAATLGGTNAGVNVYAGTIGNGSATSVALVKDGSTTWALTAANSYTGITTVSAGTLKVGNGGTTGGLGSGGVTTNAALVFDRSNAMTVANVISGTGTVEQAGAGSTALTGNNSYTGTTIVSSGTLAVGGGSTAGTLGSGSVVTNAVLAFNRSDSVTVANAISGTGAVLKQSANTLTLSGSSTYSGGTRLAAGTLIVGSDQALGTGTLSFATAGVTLQTARDVLVPIAVDATSTLSITSTAVNLTANFSGSGTLTKTGTGTLTLSGPASTFSGNLLITGGAGANSVVKAGSTAAFGTGTVTILGSGGNTGSTFDLNGHSLDNALVIGLGNSGVNDAGALMNSNPTVPATLNGAVSLGGEIYVGGAGSITFNGLMSGTVNPANDYSLYKDGAGTWTFANTGNTFDGFYYQFGGATEVTKLANLNEPSSLGQPTTSGRNIVSFGFGGNGGGTIRFIGSAASTSDRTFVMSGGTAASSTVIEASGASPVATLTLTGNLSANRAGTYAATLGGTNAGVNEYRGVIGNGSATSVALVKAGSTTWALTAANSYTGSTTISAGTLQIGNGGTVGELGGTGSVANDGVLAVNRSNAFSFSRAITGSGAFHQLGTGTTTLSGSNTYTGGAAINGGVLALGSAAALGNAGTISFGGGTLQYSSSNTTDYSGRFSTAASQQYSIDTNGQNVAVGSNLASSGGTFTKRGAGTLTLGGTNTYTGLTTIAAGRLVGSAASLPGAIANAAQLEFAQAAAGTFAAAITGTGSVTKSGTGNLVLSGTSTYTGATSVAAGRLSVNGVLGASPVAVLAAAELGGSGSIAGPVSIAAGGSLAPGNSIASLATGTATFAAASTFAYEVDSAQLGSLGTAADLLVVSGDLDLDPANGTLLSFTDLNNTPAPFVEDTTIFALINYSGSWNGGLFTYGGTPLADGSQFQAGSQWWEIDYNSPTGGNNFTSDYLPSSSFVTVMAVPEPGTLALVGIGAGLMTLAVGLRRIPR